LHPASGRAEEVLAEALQEDGGTGISAAVVVAGQLVFAATVSPDSHRPALGPGSRLRTGSIAKLFTAVAAGRLAETGTIDLHAGIGSLVPEVPFRELTPYQLGTHTSGIRHYNFGNLAEANNRTHYPQLADALAMFMNDPLLASPGQEFHYSSFGFNLLGVVLERAQGSSYEQLLDSLIARPLALGTLGVDDPTVPTACRARFSTLAFGRLRLGAPWRDNSDFYPSGGLLISASDLARFVDKVFNGNYLRPETLRLFTGEVSTGDGKSTGYGFGWQRGLNDDGKVAWYGHGGQTNGAYASVRYYPASRVTVVGMTSYNLWLTSRRAAFFDAVRNQLPTLFGAGSTAR
jgi:CubicO group peptidase (beta-lactamase class C family)